MPSRSLVATNWATASENRIHHDDVARRYGFRGGLVPGVTLYAYLTNPVVSGLGPDWLECGGADVRFASPVYDGDAIETTFDAGQVALCDSGGTVCATGTATLAPDLPVVDVPAAPLPAERPPASEASLAEGTVLGTIEHGFHAGNAEQYLSLIGEDLPIYTDEGVAHPGWLLLDANNVLAANVVLGPWIHVGSRVRHLAVVTDGQRVTTRARVGAEYERKGHRFVELDVLTLADDTPALAVRHTAIWQVRPVG